MSEPSSVDPRGVPAQRDVAATLAARLEQRGLLAQGRVTISGLDRDARQALGRLIGRHLVQDRVVLDLRELDAVIRDRLGVHGGVVQACAGVLGRPLVDRRAQREQSRRTRDAPLEVMNAGIEAWPADGTWAQEWVDDVARLGLLTRARDPVATAGQAVALVADRLPALDVAVSSHVRIARTELAARTCGDAHALDDGSALGAVVLRGLARAASLPFPSTPGQRRQLWQRYGVDHDRVSTTVLVLGLRSAAGDGPSRRLQLAADDGDPVHLTSRDLGRLCPGALRVGRVLVCENPRVLEVAADRWAGEALMVCTMGNPAAVVIDLLGLLAAAGCRLDYHGDFDWPGLLIAGRIAEAVGARPWRMGADDYLSAVSAFRGGLPLEGRPTPSPWDPRLAHAMADTGLAVHEEALLPGLLEDWVTSDAAVGRPASS
ncbi:MAG: TIGR02679 family protein [Actinomycetes bacterium]